MTADDDLRSVVVAERRAFGNVLAGLSVADWEAPSLCSGWRVRETVAHMTMPFRYSTARFLGEMVRSGGNFARMADRVARRDARASTGTLLAGWRSNQDSPWQPPGGGLEGALTHDVVHGLDITIPLGLDHPVTDRALRVVLAAATAPRSRKHFGVDLSGVVLQADDLDWSFGDGEPLRGPARHLLMVLCGRDLPGGLLSGPAAARFAAG
ncbi:MAG: hypothetical protein QOJ68_2476 [Blastococcus sp.]|nr:hypothetical protein [Blastococcus sp.]